MILEKKYLEKVSLKHRQKYAQFFTPEAVAQIMVNWLLEKNNISTLLEPAFGLGIFSRLFLNIKKEVKITGFDIDPIIFETAKQYYNKFPNINLLIQDYLLSNWDYKYDAIVCNPPYFKFHDYPSKKILKEITKKLNIKLSGFTNIYTLFLLKSIYQLQPKGRAAYLIPSEFLNANYGKYIKDYLLKSNTLRHIIIFDFQENIFDGVLTTSAIILLAKDNNDKKVNFLKVNKIEDLTKITNTINNYPHQSSKNLIKKDSLNSQLKWRIYYQKQKSQSYKNLIPFKTIAKVTRGIATGANNYFVFNEEKASQYSIHPDFLLPCITSSKDIENPFFTAKDFENLKKNNRNIYLFNGCKKDIDKNVENYINLGEKLNIDQKYLTSKRNPWYSLEKRPPPPIWVGVFNRTGLKFVRNEVGISNLTTFHCIYLQNNISYNIEIDLLFAYLLTDIAQNIFNDNSREYGNGLKKFEPNDLNNALILDLSILDTKTKNIILTLFAQYRNSVINNIENREFINRINIILSDNYKF